MSKKIISHYLSTVENWKLKAFIPRIYLEADTTLKLIKSDTDMQRMTWL